MMMSCKHATSLMSQAQDRELKLSERMQLRFHLMMCTGCTNYNKQLHIISKAMKQIAHRKPE
ncbi:MAG TPA: zf-HC2 domain-containing protein [Gammaproteobacteria bacterium]